MATSKMNQEFQKRIKRQQSEEIGWETLIRKRRESIMKHKYGIPKVSEDGRKDRNDLEK